ncbi:MAG: DUF1566 domain-containing protein [Dokdonella sp.]
MIRISRRFRKAISPALLLATSVAQAAGLPDTGQDICTTNSAPDIVSASDPASIDRDTSTFPRQDCRYGRDAAAAMGMLTKTGAGVKGFDYSKIANNGSLLAAGALLGSAAGDWACTRDNITGLVWEVKTTSGLRSGGNTYTWYSTDSATNGGGLGDNTDTTSCNGTLASCNTEAYVTAVNAGLCNATDWRVPTVRELLTLVYAFGGTPSIDPNYFPNTPSSIFWTGSTYLQVPGAWVVYFDSGTTNTANKAYTGGYIRLVRGGPF